MTQPNNRPSPGAMILAPNSKPMKLAEALGMPSEYVQLVKDVAAKGATDEEFCLFLQVVNDTGLNPLTQEIWFYRIWDAQLQREMPVIHAGIKGVRRAAEKIGGYCPGRQTEYEYDSQGNLYAATAYVKRLIAGEWHEIAFTALWDEFAKKNKDGKLVNKWATMPKHMLAKCAEFHAIGRAFPRLQSITDSEELTTIQAPEFAGPTNPGEEPPPVDEETERKRSILIDNLAAMAEILLDETQQSRLVTWMETALLEELANKHNSALIQFTQYARKVYESIPEEGKGPALEEFNVKRYEDLDFEALIRFVYMFQEGKPPAPGENTGGEKRTS